MGEQDVQVSDSKQRYGWVLAAALPGAAYPGDRLQPSRAYQVLNVGATHSQVLNDLRAAEQAAVGDGPVDGVAVVEQLQRAAVVDRVGGSGVTERDPALKTPNRIILEAGAVARW